MAKPNVYKYRYSRKHVFYLIAVLVGYCCFMVFIFPWIMSLIFDVPYSFEFRITLNVIQDKSPLLLSVLLAFLYMFFEMNYITVFTDGLERSGFGFTFLKWEEMEWVSWEKKRSMLWVGHPDSPKFIIRRKRYFYSLPVQNHEGFKADVIKYAPEGNPLREWVEGEQFEAVHAK